MWWLIVVGWCLQSEQHVRKIKLAQAGVGALAAYQVACGKKNKTAALDILTGEIYEQVRSRVLSC